MSVKINDKIGYGTMSLTWKPTPMQDAVEPIKYVTSKYNVRFLNGGEFYGANDINLKLLADFCRKSEVPSHEVIISIKGGLSADMKSVGTRENVTRSIENIIRYFPTVGDSKRPQILYEQARVDPDVPYAETVSYIYEHVKLGKIDGISVSEVSAETLALAAEVASISGVEAEFSLLSRDIVGNGVLAEASKRGIPVIAYSPLGRGLLTDYAVENAASFLDDIPEGDFRRHFDRFAPENFEFNMKLIKSLYDFAHNEKNTSLEALALSWITAISGSSQVEGIEKVGQIIPIPSGSTAEKINLNYGQLVELTSEDLHKIEHLCLQHKVKGLRYNSAMQHTLEL